MAETKPDESKLNQEMNESGVPELHVPHIDLKKFLSGNERDVEEMRKLLDEACRKHGFFVLVNHGVDMELVNNVHDCMDEFFTMPLDVKQRALRNLNDSIGYANGFLTQFSNNFPWKENFTLPCLANDNFSSVHQYVCGSLGHEFSHHGKVYKKCAKVMSDLSLKIVEILALSLDLPKEQFKKLYEDNDSVMRLNYYPRCDKPGMTLGTNPHCDPNSITVLHQDNVGGFQVYVDDQWQAIPPTKDSFVINIGDTFMSLTNGIYKSCHHRAVVNCNEARKTVGFFLSPAADIVVRAPKELVEKNPPRKYPDFTWPMLLQMMQTYHKPDANTLDALTSWIQHQNLASRSPDSRPSS